MGKKYKILAIICTLPVLLFHSRTSGDIEESVKKSSIIGTGIISSVIKNENRCNTEITAGINVLTIIKGSLKGKPLFIKITEHHWRRAF